MALFCREHECARKDMCERYRRGREMNFENDEGLWYIHNCNEKNGFKDFVEKWF